VSQTCYNRRHAFVYRVEKKIHPFSYNARFYSFVMLVFLLSFFMKLVLSSVKQRCFWFFFQSQRIYLFLCNIKAYADTQTLRRIMCYTRADKLLNGASFFIELGEYKSSSSTWCCIRGMSYIMKISIARSGKFSREQMFAQDVRYSMWHLKN
jgi:hypothetical protein